ncbi:hypothetical protein NKDENANG_00345 [Candidatus Entotheonellaceae bacterium PAL068K]
MRTGSQSAGQLSTAQQMFLALREARRKLEALERAKTEPIAIIGMGCRFPGGADAPEAFWQVLQGGVDAITEVPAERWDLEAYYDAESRTPGKSYVRSAGFLPRVDLFDPQFFSISPREAVSMDPQQRLLLEVSWEALEHAGQFSHLAGSPTGVFVGITSYDYGTLMLSGNLSQLDAYFISGNVLNAAAGRLSYTLGLQGPSMAIDTACSSSLVAIHLACQSLRNGECRQALAGGSNVILLPDSMVALCQAGVLAVDGRCKTFDAAADGYGRGEGCGVLVLKRLSDAVADGDHILALIRGSAVNQDGPSGGFTVPNGAAQQDLIRRALAMARIEPAAVDYVEAHGTGTSLGDPIEVRALTAVLGQGRLSERPLRIGSVKTNIGHLESAAGVAGVIKVVLSLQHGEIPPHLHFNTPNPHIDWEHLPVRVPTDLTPWPAETSRIAAVSSFGFSGTNAHVILEAAPQPAGAAAALERPLHLLTLSAKTEAALQQLAQRYDQHLATHTDAPLGNICFSAATGRLHFAHRLSVVAASVPQMRQQLSAFLAGRPLAGVASGQRPAPQAPRVAFLFSGQGTQSVDMGRQLYDTQPSFRQAVQRCAEILRPYLEVSLLDVLYPSGARDCVPASRDLSAEADAPGAHDHLLHQTAYTQPALFSVEYALSALWHAWGLRPQVVMGHSVGEYVAACVAGVFSLEEGLRLIAERGRLMQALPQDGDMVAVLAPETRVKAAVAPHSTEVSIAAVNGPQNVVISGQRQRLYTIVERLAAEGIETRKLNVSQAFHSPLMEPMLAAFAQIARQVTYAAAKIPLVSNVTGRLATDTIATPQYWVRHVRDTVRFAAGMATLRQQGAEVCLEIGPKPTLLDMGRQCLPAPDDPPGRWLPSLQPGRSDWQQMLESLGQLYVAGVDVDWAGFDRDYARRKVVLPTYPFQRQRYWVDVSKQKRGQGALRPLIDRMTMSPLVKQTIFETAFSLAALPFLADYRVCDAVVVPAACHLAMVLSGIEVALGNQGYQIEAVRFPEVLVLPEDGLRTVQLVLTPAETHGTGASVEFRLISFDPQDQAQTSMLHAVGHLGTPVSRPPDGVSLDALRQRFATQASSETLAVASAPGLIKWGPSFRWLEAIWRGANEALARLSVPDAVHSTAGYVLHPGLLDSGLQLAASLAVNHDAIDTLLLPAAMQALHVYQPASGKAWWCHARHMDEHRWDLQLLDELGQVVAEVIGFELQPVSPATWFASDLHTNWLYAIEWQAAPPKPELNTVVREASRGSGSWLVFGATHGLGEALAGRLQAEGKRVVLVIVGNEYAAVPSHGTGARLEMLTVNPTVLDHFGRLLQALSGIEGAIYLWGAERTASTVAEVPEMTVQLCGGVLHLVQALAQAELNPRLWVVTQGSQTLPGIESGLRAPESSARVDPQTVTAGMKMAQGAVWGLGRAIEAEYPQLHCTCVDLDDMSTDENVWVLLDALRVDDQENQVAYRQGVRHVARLRRWRPAVSVPSASTQSPEMQATASYLITGGLGALGLQVARQLVDDGARHLVLSGRRGVTSDTARDSIAQLQAAGAVVRVVQADVSKQEEVARLLAVCEAEAPLRGIVHAAGVLDDGVLAQQSLARFKQVMAPKVEGTWHLHCLSQALPLDFFVYFSTAAAVLGTPGQSNYVAANAFMDAMAQQRRLLGLPGVSINWGPWAEAGMAAEHKQRVQTQGIGMIAPAQGRQLFSQLCNQPVPQIGVWPMHWGIFCQQLTHRHASTFFSAFVQPGNHQETQISGADLRIRLASAAVAERQQLLTGCIQDAIAGVLGRQQPLALQQGFMDLGMDSLMAVELRNRLQSILNMSLSATLLFKYATIQDLVAYLSEQFMAQESMPEAAVGLAAQEQDTDTSAGGLAPSHDGIEDSIDEELQKLAQLLGD